jgi:hypothetical protein
VWLDLRQLLFSFCHKENLIRFLGNFWINLTVEGINFTTEQDVVFGYYSFIFHIFWKAGVIVACIPSVFKQWANADLVAISFHGIIIWPLETSQGVWLDLR